MTTLSSFKDIKAYFFCQESKVNATAYQHPLICLAEGFQELEVEFYSNINYWQAEPDGDYLFQHNPNISHKDCSIVIIDYEWFVFNKDFPPDFFHPSRKYITVYFESHERFYSFLPNFRRFDYILKSHYNKKLSYPSNVYPWSFGLSKRILCQLKDPLLYEERKQNILFNFRHGKQPHSLRRACENKFIPVIQSCFSVDSTTNKKEDREALNEYHNFHNYQTGGRHFPDYYERLKHTAACACFGGFYMSPLFKDPTSIMTRISKKIITHLSIETTLVAQWESWRFWESLAAGCITFHVDFEKYGVLLPVMPTNFRHYIGVDFSDIKEIEKKILKNHHILNEISVQDREWSIKYYSPSPAAKRFLELVILRKSL